MAEITVKGEGMSAEAIAFELQCAAATRNGHSAGQEQEPIREIIEQSKQSGRGRKKQ